MRKRQKNLILTQFLSICYLCRINEIYVSQEMSDSSGFIELISNLFEIFILRNSVEIFCEILKEMLSVFKEYSWI